MGLATGLHGLIQLIDQLLLTISEIHRGLNHNPAQKIPHGPATHRLYPLATHTEQLSGLGPSRYLELYLTIQGWHLQLTPQGRRGKADWHLTVEMIVLPREDLMLLDGYLHIEITRRAAMVPGLC